MEVGESQVGTGYRTVKIGSLLRVATLISKYVNLDAQGQWKRLAEGEDKPSTEVTGPGRDCPP